MMRHLNILFSILFFLCCAMRIQVSAQSDFGPIEEKMNYLLNRMSIAESDDDRQAYHDSLRTVVQEVVNSEGCLTHPFSSIEKMSVLSNDNQTFKLFNWNLPFNDQTHTYGCFMVWMEDEKQGITDWAELSDNVDDYASVENKYLTPEKWQGALYYDLVEVKKKKKKKAKHKYILLGWDGADALTNRKIIEVVDINRGKVRLGAPIFDDVPKKRPKRYAIAYSEEVMVSLKYHPKDKRIVFDHVAPRAAGLEGNPAFYGPDLTFDSFEFEKGKWLFKENIDITLSKEQSKRPFFDPQNQ